MESLNIGSAFIFASISLIISLVTIFVNVKSSKRETFTAKMGYYGKILDWYKETIFLMKRIEHKSDIHESYEWDLASLSAQVEYGRFFFPNIQEDEYGEDKPEAYRGFRNITLDFIVAYYNLFKLNLRGEFPIDAPTIIQRYFTSEVFKLINPKSYVKQAEKCVDSKLTNEDQLRHQIGKNDQNLIIDLVFNYR
ncbi:MAG TPA: hypothetical protein DEZ27_01090 [Sphaerochaeta sp.]|nr:hypothetical protein [Sphaerochaeta sp.]